MDPRLYHYERRTPRLQNPTYKSQFVTQSLHVYKGGPLDSNSVKKQKITQIPFKQHYGHQMFYQPPEISKIRSIFQNNRSKVPLSHLSSYGRQIMFPTQKVNNQREEYNKRDSNPQKFFKKELFLDNKQKNYIKQMYKMNDQFLTRSRMGQSLDLTSQTAGKATYNDKDKRYYRYKHSYDRLIEQDQNKNQSNQFNQSNLSKSFIPSRLNYADQLKGII